MSALEDALRNSILRAQWRAKRIAGVECPDPWPPVARAWFDRYLERERLGALIFLGQQDADGCVGTYRCMRAGAPIGTVRG